MVLNGNDPNNNLGIQKFSQLEKPTKHQYLIVIRNLMPKGTRFFGTDNVEQAASHKSSLL